MACDGRKRGTGQRLGPSPFPQGSPPKSAAPETPQPPADWSGGLLLLDVLVGRVRGGLAPRSNGDPARLHGLRHLAHQVDLQDAILEPCIFDVDMIGQIELAAERPSRDAMVKVLVVAGRALAGFDGQHVLLGRDGDVLRAEARQRQGDLVEILAGPLNVVGGVVVLVAGSKRLVEKIENAVEADG